MGSKADDVSHGGAAAAVLLDALTADMKRDSTHDVKETKDEVASGAEAADGLQAHHGQPDKTDIPIDPSMETSKSSDEEDTAAEAEELQTLTTEINQSEQIKENNTQQVEKVSSIVNSKDPSTTANAGSANLVLPPSDQPSVLYVTLPPKDAKEEEEKSDDTCTTQQAQHLPAAQKVVKSDITTAMVAAQPNIGAEDAIAKCTTPARPLAASQSSGDNNDGEEKKMDDEDLAIAQPRSPPTTPGINTSGVLASAKVVPSPLGASSMSTPQSDTTKAKSMPTPSSTTCSSSRGNDGHDGRSLEEMMTTDDMANATMEQKVDGLKLLLSIIKNLSDPELSTDPSHHMIPWDCEDSISGILRSCPFVGEYLTERIGFAPLTKSGETFLCLFDTDDEGSYAGIDESILQRALLEVNYALARLDGREQEEEETMPEEKKENKLSDQNEPRTSVAASANQEAAYSMLTLASGSNAIIGDITNGNVAAKLVQVEVSDAGVSKEDVAKTGAVTDPTVIDNSSTPVSMHDAKVKLCASPAVSTDVETETEDVPGAAMMVEDGNDGKLPFVHHTTTSVDSYVEPFIKPGARTKKNHCAHFDTVSIGGCTTLGAWVLVNVGQFIVPDGSQDGFGSKGILHKEINIQAFRNDNANFVEGSGEPKADTDCFELDIRIELTNGSAIHCAFDGCDPDRIVNEDGRTARQTLCQFAQNFVRIHECWLKKNPEEVDEVCSQKQNTRSTEAERSSSPSTKDQRSCVIDLEASYRPNSKREQMLNDFVSYVSEEAPALVPMALAWAEGNCSTDDMICNVAGLLRSQKDIDRFNELLLEEANGYSMESRCGAAAWNGDPLLFYRCPDGIQTTDRKTRQLLLQFNEAQSRDEQCIFLEEYLRPLPDDYHEMKESNFVSLVLGISECKEFDLAIRLLEGAEAVCAEQDAPSEDVFAPMYNLRGQVLLKQAKEMIAECQANAGSGIDYLFEDNANPGDCYQTQQVLSNASEWLTTAKTTMEGMMTDPIPEFGAQDECELALLQDLCTLTMRIGKSYELQGDTPNAIETYEEALSLLYTVRPASSSRIAAAHLDLGDLCAKTLIPNPPGTWAGDNDNMARAVGHYLSSARSVAAYVATESRKVDSDFFIGPGTNTLSQVREVLHEHEDRGEQINIGIWACREINEMVEMLRNSDAMHFGQPWFSPVNQAVDLVRNRLKEMARHPMHRDRPLGRVKVKQERKEALVGPLPFTINEGDSHKENSLPPLELESHHCNTRASKISKMEKYGDVTWARECNNAQDEKVDASFYDEESTSNFSGV